MSCARLPTVVDNMYHYRIFELDVVPVKMVTWSVLLRFPIKHQNLRGKESAGVNSAEFLIDMDTDTKGEMPRDSLELKVYLR